MTSLSDAHDRVSNHPYRTEAESMILSPTYKIIPISPFEAASNATAIMTTSNTTDGAGTAVLPPSRMPAPDTYDLAINYFDVIGGRATWDVFVGETLVGSWRGDMEDRLGHATTMMPDETSAARITFPGVIVAQGDELRVVGTPDGIEAAFLDYVSFLPPGVVD